MPDQYTKATSTFHFHLSGYNDSDHQQSDANWTLLDTLLNSLQAAVVAQGGTPGGEVFLDGGSF